MKVWVAEAPVGSYDRATIGIYSTEENANAALARHRESNPDIQDWEVCVDAFEVDAE